MRAVFTTDRQLVRDSMRQLPQDLFYNRFETQELIYEVYAKWIAATQTMIVYDDLGEVIVVVPMGIDTLTNNNTWCYIPAMFNAPAIAPSYPTNPDAPEVISGEWLDLLPEWYMDADISSHSLPSTGRQAVIPTASVALVHGPKLFDYYSKSRRKSTKRTLMHCLIEYTKEQGSLDDLEMLFEPTVAKWDSRFEDHEFMTPRERLDGLVTWLWTIALDTRRSQELLVTRWMDKAGNVAAINVVHKRDGGAFYDDYLCWIREDVTDPIGIASTVDNIMSLGETGTYNLGSPFCLGEVANHHQYKLDLIPEAIRGAMALVSTFPDKRVASVFGFMPPYRACGEWVTSDPQPQE